MSRGPPHMPAPVCLIENAEGGLRTVESALDILRGIQQPVVVVAVVGLYHTGKSYLMNRLAGQQSGFALGSTIDSKTKGIWMWCVPYPSKPGHTLLLLDTEGLGDVDKGDSKNDAWIFCLGVLLSSTLVYNSRGTIDNEALEKLHYVTELTNHIRMKSAGARDEDDEEKDSTFVRFFPDFIWAVRDFTLERKIDGHDVSEDEYLDFALQLKKGQSTKLVTYNQARQCIWNFFPTRKCFTFSFPTSAKKMKHLDSMAEADLCPDFLSDAKRFCSYVFAKSRVKTVQGGHKVTGSRFSHLVKIYVDTINSGSVPSLENSVVALAEIENQSAVNAGFQLYEQGMGDLSKTFPKDLKTVSAEHQRLSTMATQEFLKHSFKDEEGKYMRQLVEKVSQLYEKLINLNMEVLAKQSRKLLCDMHAPMATNIQQAKSGGYEIYCRDRDAIVAEYKQHDKKGMKLSARAVCGEQVLEKCLQEKNTEAKSILKAEEELTESEKKITAMSGGPPHMPAPVCLIENAEEGLRTVESALDILRGIQQPVVVVAVVGLYRTGKSYLMNRLAGQQSGFALGSTIESKTKGIWMWCVPHPSKSGHTLLLLDTEGLGDVDKGDSKNDAWIFCLSVLLSSTLVYNSRGTIDNQALEKLHYVTELTDHIQIKSAAARDEDDEDDDEEDCTFVRFFPDFVWAVRDFTLERKIDGHDVSEDEYLDFALQLKKGQSTKVLTYNQPRQCIRNFFPTRKCFTFPFPTLTSNMTLLDSMAEADLCPDFLGVADRFCKNVFAESRVKRVWGGHKVTGSRFIHLVKIYVDTINSGSIPCLENAVVAMAKIENRSAMNEGFQLYEQGMRNLSKTFPTDVGTVSAEHHRLDGMATQEFLKRSVKDEGGGYMAQLAEKVSQLYEKLITLNMEASEELCRKLLLDLYAPIVGNIQQGSYAKAGGYETYCTDRDAMVVKYRQHDKKGMKGEEVLVEFLQEKNAETKSILMADEKLTESDKKMAEASEKERVQKQKIKAKEQRYQDLQRALEDESRSQEARGRSLREKKEEEKQLQHEELERALENKQKEQREMLEQGFKDQADIMGQEIEQLKKEKQQNQEAKPSISKKISNVLSSMLEYKGMRKKFKSWVA
ncbi:guanylate-binding protein 1-like [Clupea harengus]|uniref:Guanylate-binding protein 1-like n=1 Tax=Clupea harengus TaxID=7950 RepID=A0A6P8F5E9_CLUHA|nr:guanylate-binding protein 1-like [Clupea harengus]